MGVLRMGGMLMKTNKKRVTKTETTYECEYCGKTFNSWQRCIDHERSCMISVCPKCGYELHNDSMNVYFSDRVGFVAACPRCTFDQLKKGSIGRMFTVPAHMWKERREEVEAVIKKIGETDNLKDESGGYLLCGRGIVSTSR